MKLSVHHHCADFSTYRAARVKSLFNVDSGADFCLDAELPVEDRDWKIGVIVGPSGSGKTSLGAAIGPLYAPDWPDNLPLVEAISPGGDFDAVTGALASVGLGSVPAWLRPYPVLSNGEKFRAMLARLVCDAPDFAVVDEFSSVVDRQIARVGAGAFAKAWRRTDGQVVLLSCHYDILDWINPDWVFDTATGLFDRGRLRRRPPLQMAIYQTDWRFWPLFEPHHYLTVPHMILSKVLISFSIICSAKSSLSL
jgi:ABC-type transport system involved in cytochrome c biogenesis ATPase subunit